MGVRGEMGLGLITIYKLSTFLLFFIIQAVCNIVDDGVLSAIFHALEHLRVCHSPSSPAFDSLFIRRREGISAGD